MVYDEAGQVQTVQYRKLVPLLLNEWQKNRKRIVQQEQVIAGQAKELAVLKTRLATVETQNRDLKALEARLVRLERIPNDAPGRTRVPIRTRHHE